MITLPILIVCIVLFAWKEALDDARAIAESNKTGKPFTHDDPDRYIMGIVITLILSVASQLEHVTWWALLYFPITWAVFTISFRFLLNRKRGMDWRYISPSNGYDYIFLCIGDVWQWKPADWDWKNWCGFMKSQHWPNYDFTRKYRAGVHRSGSIAYATESAVLAISLTIYITKTL